MLALCVENASLSPLLLLRTCALTLVSGLFGVPSVEGHLPKGEVNSTNFLSTLAFFLRLCSFVDLFSKGFETSF